MNILQKKQAMIDFSDPILINQWYFRPFIGFLYDRILVEFIEGII